MEIDKNIYGKSGINIVGATLLSTEEAEKLSISLRRYTDWWWLKTPGTYQAAQNVAFVFDDGFVDYGGAYVNDWLVSVRPVLKIENLKSSNLRVGDTFDFGGKEFEIISGNAAFCCTDIGCYPFRKDWKADDAGSYEASDVKKFVDNWFTCAVQVADA